MSLFHLKHEVYTKMAYYLPCLPPDRFVFVLTNQCNLNCRECFQDRVPKKNLLPKERWIALSKAIPGFSRITMTGGEPLLFSGFEEVFRNVALGHECNLITNGILLTRDLIDSMVALPKFKVLAISIDDLRSSERSIRGLSERQWDNLEDMLKYFITCRDKHASRCTLEIKTLILNDNADKLFDIHRYCMEKIGADHHTFQFLKGTPLQHSDRSFDIKQIFEEYHAPVYEKFGTIVRELDRIREYNIVNKKKAFLHPVVSDLNTGRCLGDISFLNNSRFNRRLFQPCKFPWSSVHINYDGELFPCLSVSVGNVREQPVKQVLEGRFHKDFLSIIRREGIVPACNNCGWLRPVRRQGAVPKESI